MEITPVYLKGENAARVLTGAVIMLRPRCEWGVSYRTFPADVGAFSQIIAVSPKMRHVIDRRASWQILRRRC